MQHQVIVGNIGTVYDGTNGYEARNTYFEFVRASKSGKGRAGGEDVTWMKGDDIHKEHQGSERRES